MNRKSFIFRVAVILFAIAAGGEIHATSVTYTKGSDGSNAHQYKNPCKVSVNADPGIVASKALYLEPLYYSFSITAIAAPGWKIVSAKYKDSSGEDVTLQPPSISAAAYWQFSAPEDLSDSLNGNPRIVTVHFATLRQTPSGSPDYEEDIIVYGFVVEDLWTLDIDNNGLGDAWETEYFGHVGNDPNGDPDGDFLTNLDEFKNWSDPLDNIKAPTQLTAKILTSSSIRLSWKDNSVNETNFLIQRSTNGSDWQQIALTNANRTSYDDLSLSSSSFYKYRVIAHKPDHDSIPSNIVSGKINDSTLNTGLADTDHDGLPDWWEMQKFGNLNTSGSTPISGKPGVTYKQAYDYGLDLVNASTVGDGVPDSWKLQFGFDPSDLSFASSDSDQDGLSNAEEYAAGTSPRNPNSDNDDYWDGYDPNPLIPNPSFQNWLQIKNPQGDDGKPDYSAVDLKWDAAKNGPSYYVIERQINSDDWETKATTSSTTYHDPNLLANQFYHYRVTAVKMVDNVAVKSYPIDERYQRPLELQVISKFASSSNSKLELFAEYGTASTPPKYYRRKDYTETQVDKKQPFNAGANESVSWDSISNYLYTYTRTMWEVITPVAKKKEYSYTETTVGSGAEATYILALGWGAKWNHFSYSANNIFTSYWLTQERTPSNRDYIQSSGGKEDDDTTYTDSGYYGNSSFKGTSFDSTFYKKGQYVPNDEPAHWMGGYFDPARGHIEWSGTSKNLDRSVTIKPDGTWPSNAPTTFGNGTSFPAIDFPPTTASTSTTKTRYWKNGGDQSFTRTYNGDESLSLEYPTSDLITDAGANLPNYLQLDWETSNYQSGLYSNGLWMAWFNLSNKEREVSLSTAQYKLKAAPSAPTTFRWHEIFFPDDDSTTTDKDESQDVVVLASPSYKMGANSEQSSERDISDAKTRRKNGTYRIVDRVQLYSDLNNDGRIDDADRFTHEAGSEPDATADQKEKATEYIFVNDNLSNGSWDKDDPDPKKPNDEWLSDDDALAITIKCGISKGVVWFEHPVIDKLAFYKTAQCKPEDKLAFPLPWEKIGQNTIYLRVEDPGHSITREIAGDLVFNVGKNKGEIWSSDKLTLNIIKQLGDKDYFKAARNYIGERNTALFVHDTGYPITSPTTIFRICTMREEATTLSPIETFYHGPKLGGIESVAKLRASSATVLINGNQVAFSDGSTGLTVSILDVLNSFNFAFDGYMTDRCRGRIGERTLDTSSGAFSRASSDYYDEASKEPGTSMYGSVLSGPDPIPGTANPGGKYVAQGKLPKAKDGTGKITFAAGRVPTGFVASIGGLSSNYNSSIRASEPSQMIGYAPLSNDGRGCIFTASEILGAGLVPVFQAAAKASGVPSLTGGSQPSDLSLLILDSGDTSVALMHKNGSNEWKVDDEGFKHFGLPYYVNTYLALSAKLPR